MKNLILSALFLLAWLSVFSQDLYVKKVTISGAVECFELVKISEEKIGIGIGDTTGFVLSNDSVIVTFESNVILDTEGAVALDTVITLTGVIGQIVYISTRNSERDIRFLDGGNFSLGAERTLDNINDVLGLKATSATTWKEISFANND